MVKTRVTSLILKRVWFESRDHKIKCSGGETGKHDWLISDSSSGLILAADALTLVVADDCLIGSSPIHCT